MIERRLPDLRSITCEFFPLHFGRWPPDRRSMIGLCPTGRRRTRKSGEESADDPANFNCELNLPDRRRMRAQGVLNWQMAVGFLQDSIAGSPHGDPAIDFALLGRGFKVTVVVRECIVNIMEMVECSARSMQRRNFLTVS